MSILIWFVGGLVWIPQILVLAEMGTAYAIQGGPYYYLNKAGSPFLAFLYTWTAFLTSDTPTLTIVALSAITVLEVFSPSFADPFLSRILAGALIVIVAVLHYRSVRMGGNVQIILTLAKLAPLLSIVVIGLFFLNSGNLYFPIGDPDARQVGIAGIVAAGVSATLWSYAGFTNILYMAGEVRSPQQTLPRALIGSLLFIIGAYTLISACTSAIVPYGDLVAARGGFINPFSYLPALSGSAATVFAVAAFVSMLGVLNATLMAQPRLEYAIARDGLFFPVFGHLHPRFLTPDYSILIQAGLAILLFVIGDLEALLGYFTVSYALQNALVYGAIIPLRRRDDYRPTYRAPHRFLTAILAVGIQLAVAVGSFLAYPAGGGATSLALILSGLPIYLYFRSRKRPREQSEP
jgi:fructoselysine transporter